MDENKNSDKEANNKQQSAPKKNNKGRFLSQILSGKLFRSDLFINNIWLMLLIVFYSFIYVSNRYAYRQELKQIKQLKAERQDAQYRLLTKQSEFSEKSRQSNIETYVNRYQSQLKTATNPPFTVK